MIWKLMTSCKILARARPRRMRSLTACSTGGTFHFSQEGTRRRASNMMLKLTAEPCIAETSNQILKRIELGGSLQFPDLPIQNLAQASGMDRLHCLGISRSFSKAQYTRILIARPTQLTGG